MRSEVTLNANVEAYHILVRETVLRHGLRSRRSRQNSRTSELLVDVEPHGFGRERQVLDRSPTGDHTELRDVVVRVANEVRRPVCGDGIENGTSRQLRIAVESHARVAAEQAA